MKATDILEKLKEVFRDTDSVELSTEAVEAENTELTSTESEEVIKDVISDELSNKEVVLAEDEVVVDEVKEVAEQPSYATLSDLKTLKNEILDMLAAFAEVSKEYNKEVPSELSSDEVVKDEVIETELSSEEVVTEIAHSPESHIETKKVTTKLSNRRPLNTQDRVFAKLFK